MSMLQHLLASGYTMGDEFSHYINLSQTYIASVAALTIDAALFEK